MTTFERDRLARSVFILTMVVAGCSASLDYVATYRFERRIAVPGHGKITLTGYQVVRRGSMTGPCRTMRYSYATAQPYSIIGLLKGGIAVVPRLRRESDAVWKASDARRLAVGFDCPTVEFEATKGSADFTVTYDRVGREWRARPF